MSCSKESFNKQKGTITYSSGSQRLEQFAQKGCEISIFTATQKLTGHLTAYLKQVTSRGPFQL